MICPVCRKSMLVVEYSEIELDYCDTCKGVWFDSGELELLLESEKPDVFISNILKAAEAKSVNSQFLAMSEFALRRRHIDS